MHIMLIAVALGASALPTFPRDAGGRIAHAALGVAIDGAPAIVVAAGERVVAYRADGPVAGGFPFSLGADEAASGAPAAADVDGDRRPEIAVVTLSGKLFLWSGRVLPGFPVSLGAKAKAGPSFADVDGDGRPEVLVGDERGRIHAFHRGGSEARGFPLSVARSAVTSTVSASRFAGGLSIAFGCEDGSVHVVDVAGRERPGFPLVTHFAVTGAPAFADLDEDGEMELVVASQDFSLYVVNGKGQPLPGFPVAAGYRIYDGAAIADLDGDGHLDVVFASADGFVHAVDRNGKRLRGFPVRAGVRMFGGPVIGDLDRDGALDVAAVAADGTVAAWSGGGKPLVGFPSQIDGNDVSAGPLLQDIAGDGSLSIIVGVPAGRLHAVRAARAGTTAAAAPWPGPGRDSARSGRYGPNPPAYRDLKIAPAEPRATDRLGASWKGVWLDAGPGEAVPTPRIEWLRNGKAVAALEGRRELPPGTGKRGERWRFALGGNAGAAGSESAEVRILDSAPAAPEVALEPAAPSRSAPVKLVVKKPAADVDGDPITYRIEWFLDGLDAGVSGDKFPGERLRKGALLSARVVASDGEMESPAVSVSGRVGNTPPGPLVASLEPAAPRRPEALKARIERPAVDPDGDKIEYHYRWKVDGELRNAPIGTAELPAGTLRKRQKVQVEIRAFDGQAEGEPAVVETVVKNSVPTAPHVEIRPAKPRRGDALRAVVVAPAQDADGDTLSYRIAWRKNGQVLQVPGDGREVPGSEVARGDRFELTVSATDGEAEGPKAQAMAVILNTPPEPPRIAVEPAHPRGGQALKVVVLEPARDADGDAVTLSYAWSRDGRPVPGKSGDGLAPGDFKKHERVRVLVTPRDAEDAGEAAAFEVTVYDAPPGAPVVALAPDRATVTAPLRAVIQKPAPDADGDAVKYRYRWLRDGVAVPLPDGNEASRREPYWTSIGEVPAGELRKRQTWEVQVQAWDGEQYGPVVHAGSTVANSPPPAPEVAFVPERPRRVDGLGVAVRQPPDPDGDAITYRYTWTRNGERFAAAPDQAQVGRGVPRRGERWAVEVVASDGETESPPVRREITIVDTAPGPASVALCDGPVPAGTVLQAKVTAGATDADGDAIAYKYDWTVNGKPVPAATGLVRLAQPALRKHDVARVVVTPTDGELTGPPVSAECVVENTPPGAPVAALEPAQPTAQTGLRVQIQRPSADRDGDAVSYRMLWSRNGVRAPQEGGTLPPGAVHHGEVWRVEVVPWDGEAEGERVVLQTVVRNTSPPAPTVKIEPREPAVGQSITCEARAPDRDSDDEPVTLRYRWWRDGRAEPVAEGMATLPVAVVKRGERWKCEAWTNDGFADSAHASAEAAVKNSPPGAPQVTIDPERPRKSDDLFCRIAVEASDPDGDPVRYGYAWLKNDRPVQPGPNPVRIEASRLVKGDRWKCTATPSDGALAGPPASAERTIQNSPPGPASARIAPAAPSPGQPLRCEIVVKSEDPDGDPVRYRFAWQRNGAAQPFAESSQEVPPRLIRAGDRWRCVVTPTDGDLDGPDTGTGEVEVSPAPGTAATARSPGDRP